MAELIDYQELAPSQIAELYEGSEVWIHDNGTFQDIKLGAKAATLLFDFLLRHQERLLHHQGYTEAEIKHARELQETGSTEITDLVLQALEAEQPGSEG